MKTKHLIFILGMTALLSGSYLIGKTLEIEASKGSPRVTTPVIRARKPKKSERRTKENVLS